MKRTALRQRSSKRNRDMVARRKLVAKVLSDRPWCEAQLAGVCTGRSSEVHEVLARGRGGDFLDETNTKALCHSCHAWVTCHPIEATELGLMRSAWPPAQLGVHVTFSARFKVQDVSDGPAPINVLATASVEDGTLTVNTEKARSMELRVVIDADETTIKPGDEITASGHFTA